VYFITFSVNAILAHFLSSAPRILPQGMGDMIEENVKT
jgi:hypothetical protein